MMVMVMVNWYRLLATSRRRYGTLTVKTARHQLRRLLWLYDFNSHDSTSYCDGNEHIIRRVLGISWAVRFFDFSCPPPFAAFHRFPFNIVYVCFQRYLPTIRHLSGVAQFCRQRNRMIAYTVCR